VPKKKKGVRKGKAKASQNTKVNANLKVTITGTLAIGAGASTGIDNYTLGYVTELGPFGSNGASFFQNPDYRAQSSLYDEVCIKSYTIKFTPLVTVTNLYDQGFAISAGPKTRVQPNLYTWFDRDASPLTAINVALPTKIAQYDSYKKHNCFKQWSRTMRMKPIWLSCDGVAGGSHMNSEATTQLTQAGLLGNFGVYGQNLPWAGSINSGNEAYGQFAVVWTFLFRGKRPVNTTVDADGVVTLTPASLFAPIIPTLAFPTMDDVGGQLVTLDVSGNPIYVLP